MMRRPSRIRGVTLVELLAVVAIVGILAVLAVVGYQRYYRSATTGQTRDMLVHIATGQHKYYSETRGYLRCSDDYGNGELYPMLPNGKKHLFHNPGHLAYDCWKLFRVDADAATYASFITIADVPGSAISAPPTKQAFGYTSKPDQPWFIVYAAADQDADGNREQMYTSSFQPGQVHVENPGD